MSIKKTWNTNRRVDITFSLEDKELADNAWWRAVDEIERLGGGWTSREGSGGWRGAQEVSFTISQVGVGPEEDKVILTVEELFDSGCESVQVEIWESASPYRCEEWKQEPQETLPESWT
jgi:hypothetical protein